MLNLSFHGVHNNIFVFYDDEYFVMTALPAQTAMHVLSSKIASSCGKMDHTFRAQSFDIETDLPHFKVVLDQ
jgi:hypothetical protein